MKRHRSPSIGRESSSNESTAGDGSNGKASPSSSRSTSPRSSPMIDDEELEEYNQLIASRLELPLVRKATLEAHLQGDEGGMNRSTPGDSGGKNVDGEGRDTAEDAGLDEQEQEFEGRPMTKAEKQNAKKKRRKERERAEREAAQRIASPDPASGGEVAASMETLPFKLFSNRPLDSVYLAVPKEEYPIPMNPRHTALPADVIDKIRTYARDAALDPPDVPAWPTTRRTRAIRTILPSDALTSLQPTCAVINIVARLHTQPRAPHRLPELPLGTVSRLEVTELVNTRPRKRPRKHSRGLSSL